MSFSKNDLDKIKNKILLSSEIEKKTSLTKKGKDCWCCCLFHKEKTPSLKINDELGSFYCFGCGAKGDIFTIYTDYYNYTFQDAVRELANLTGIKIEEKTNKNTKQENFIFKILELSCQWFQNNLKKTEASSCRKYLNSRKISEEAIKKFRLGFSYNNNEALYNFLKQQSFSEENIIKSNIVKIDKNNNKRDYFYKRLIFPISDERGNVLGFGGRSIDDSNPKYINSPESFFFKKRNILYNLNNAKFYARKKNNLLICEGYMDVISLYQKGIYSVVSPLGTALTDEQLSLSWKYSTKPTIMFDGDKAGLRAAFKSALMSLSLLSSKKFLQFITLKDNYDPDSFINTFSFKKFLDKIKKPVPLVNFVFNESKKAFYIENADGKILFDKYLEELSESIKDKKIKYFYKKEFKSLFFDSIRFRRKESKNKLSSLKKINSSLYKKQILSFLSGCLNHKSVRKKILHDLLKLNIFDSNTKEILNFLNNLDIINEDVDIILKSIKNENYLKLIDNSMDPMIYQLFPYASPRYDAEKSYYEIKKSSENLNTRLLKSEKINKSLDSFSKNSSQLNWDELQSMNLEILNDK